MAPSEPPTTITLKVKVPPGTIDGGADDVALGSVDVSTTIGNVRQQLQQIIPSHPLPERQRLLYGGRVLVDDAQTLSDALNVKRDPSQMDYVIHMIVKGDGFNASSIRGGSSSSSGTHQAMRIDPRHEGSVPPPTTTQAPGVSEHARVLFDRAVATGQQQRAALGMHGVTGQPMASSVHAMAPPVTETENPLDPSSDTPQQQHTPGATQPVQHATTRSVNSQGFHLQGVGPDGQRFQVHHQTINLPMGQQLPQMGQLPNMLHMPHMPHLPQFPQIAQLPMPIQMPHAHHGPHMHHHGTPASMHAHPHGHTRVVPALDQARENMTELRRMLDEIRDGGHVTEEQRNQLGDIERRAQAINDYIDPFNFGSQGTTTRPSVTTGMPHLARHQMHRAQPPSLHQPPTGTPRPRTPPTVEATDNNTSEVTCYLLSSPQGPQALLFSPQHGTYTSASDARIHSLAAGGAFPLSHIQAATGSSAANEQRGQDMQLAQRPDPVAEAVHQQVQDLQQAQAQARAEQGGPAQALLGHFWLLFRILVFTYFLLGSDLGWRRPLALAVIGLGFWLMRLGLFADGGVARGWWDGIMAVPPRQGQEAAAAQGAAAGETGPGRAAMPTPEQLAERLLAERDRARNGRWRRMRELVRPIERATALFVASLWPGVGEAQVQATEREERRRQEEEANAQRREEEEAAQRREEEASSRKREEEEKARGEAVH